jgi:predicted GTPase
MDHELRKRGTSGVGRYWREVLLVVLVALPWVSLLLLGILWLWQGGYVWIWALAAGSIGLLSWPLWYSVNRRSKQEARIALGDLAEPSRGWHAAERDAWTLVLSIADETAPLDFLELDPVLALARNTIEAVARRFHAEAEDAWARFSLPEAMLLGERVCRDIRREALRRIPGVRSVKFSHMLWLKSQNERYGAVARLGWQLGYGLWRVVRAGINPLQAVGQEVSGMVLDQTTGVLSLRVRSYATRLLVLEVGRAAIDLYSGRLTLSEEELRAAQQRDMPAATDDVDMPVRILLAGQVSAGKSSLLNALAQEVRGAVGPVPTTTSASEFLLDQDGRPSVVLVDMAGVDGSAAVTEELMRQAERADLVLWVAAAMQPARAHDRSALDALRAKRAAQVSRRPAPILLALTHVDQLRPAAEWSPPYDIATPTSPKAQAIRGAMDSVARTLGVPIEAIVPVAVPPGQKPYNLDALWARIGLEIDEAKLVQLDRLRFSEPSFRLRELPQQLSDAGRLIIKELLRS